MRPSVTRDGDGQGGAAAEVVDVAVDALAVVDRDQKPKRARD
jgi:hypothetical protein